MHALILSHIVGVRILTYEVSQKLKSFKQEYANNNALFYFNILDNLKKEILS